MKKLLLTLTIIGLAHLSIAQKENDFKCFSDSLLKLRILDYSLKKDSVKQELHFELGKTYNNEFQFTLTTTYNDKYRIKVNDIAKLDYWTLNTEYQECSFKGKHSLISIRIRNRSDSTLNVSQLKIFEGKMKLEKSKGYFIAY